MPAIITRFSSVPGIAPSSGQLLTGELAVNVADRKLYTLDASNNVVLLASGGLTPTDPFVITVNSSSPALTVIQSGSGGGVVITNTGSGNALVVEDSTNPDSTPFVVNASGQVGIGLTTPATSLQIYNASTASLRIDGDAATNTTITRYSSDVSSPNHTLRKARGTFASPSAVNSFDFSGSISFQGFGGTNYRTTAQIISYVDVYTSDTNISGALAFTTNSGGTSASEKMRITAAGNVGIGGVPASGQSLVVSKNITGNVDSMGVRSVGTVQSDVTSSARAFDASFDTAATAFTLSNAIHYYANGITVGSGSTVTNQYGFFANSPLTGATNNFGFYSDIASGTGRWNFYAAGTASNFFGGDTTISVNSTSDALRITQVGTGNALVVEDSANPDATPFVVNASGRVGVGNSSPAQPLDITSNDFGVRIARFSATPTLGSGVDFRKSASGTIGTQTIVANNEILGRTIFSGSDGIQFIPAAQIIGEVDGTPGTNDMPGRLVFGTTADGASTTTERMRIDSAGNVGIGGGATAGITLDITKAQTGATTAFTVSARINPDSTVTSAGYGFATYAINAVGANTPDIFHYYANQGTYSGTAPTQQYGFVAASTLTGATNNYGFYSDIASGTGRWNFYANGTAKNVFAGQTSIGGLEGAEGLRVTTVASSVNYFQVNGNITGSSPILYATGSDTNVGAVYGTKGNGAHAFYSNAFTQLQFVIAHTASSVNYLQVTGSTTGNSVILSSSGSDANVPIAIIAKGTGIISLDCSNTASTAFGIELCPNTTVNRDTYIDFHSSSGTDYDFRIIRNSGANNSVAYTNQGTGAQLFFTNNTAEQFRVAHTASAVNYVQVTGAATGARVALSAQGSDTNVSINYTSKGTGIHAFNTGGGTQFVVDTTASAVNYVQATGSATGSGVTLSAQGSDSNVQVNILAKGSAGVSIGSYSGKSGLFVSAPSAAVNYVQADGANTGSAPQISAQGSDTNINLLLAAKGTGNVQITSNNLMPYQGAPTSKSGAATLSGAELVTGILNTTGTTYTITLPTGTNIEGALTWSANNVSLDFFVINTASGTITIGANGNTTLGSLTIATGTSAQFRIRRTAANAFTVYRLG